MKRCQRMAGGNVLAAMTVAMPMRSMRAHLRNRQRSRCNFLRDGCLGRAAKEVAGRNRFAAQTPIDTAPTAAVPIMVKTTRRERFMVRLLRPLNG